MMRMAGIAGAMLAALAFTGTGVAQQQPGVVASGPPEDIFLEVTLGEGGEFTISQEEYRLAQGGYYRFNLVCPEGGVENEAGIAFTALDLWKNSHLRIVSVSTPESGFMEAPEINFHMQGLQVGMIECEGLNGAARVSFFPMRKGTFPFTVLNDTGETPVEVEGAFIVE